MLHNADLFGDTAHAVGHLIQGFADVLVHNCGLFTAALVERRLPRRRDWLCLLGLHVGLGYRAALATTHLLGLAGGDRGLVSVR